MRSLAPRVPLAASLVLLLAGAGLLIAAARSPAPALAGTPVTSQVIAGVSADLARVYSYSYTSLPAAETAAGHVLAGQAAAQYRELSPMLRDAVTERLTVTARVTRAGLMSWSGGTARLLVFLSQSSARPGDKASVVSAQLIVTARSSGGRWIIESIEVP